MVPGRVLVALLSVVLAGCGYVLSGRWEDDPKNWSRAFHSVKPDDVVVVHSEYWRNPHWSYEAGYSFEIEPNTKLREQLFKENSLSRALGVREVKSLCFSACPSWFAPEAIDRYEIWTYANEPHGNFRVLVDKETGTLFLTDYQV